MQYGSGDYIFELVNEWAKLPEGKTFLDIGSVCITDDNDVLVLNRSQHPMMAFNKAGEYLYSWENIGFSSPHGMCIDGKGDIYCTDDGDHTVKKFTPKGEALMTLGSKNNPSKTGYRHVSDLFERISSISQGGGPFNRPTDITVLDSGELFISDGYGNARVHKFSPEGDLINSWGEPGANQGEFRLPHSIHHDSEDRIWITDRENSRIQIFDTDGKFIEEWTDLVRPTGIAIHRGLVFVSELCRRVSIFTIDGELLTRWGNEKHSEDDPLFVAPHTIAIDSEGDLYIGEVSYAYGDIDRGARTIQKFERVN